jgi:hypothetical protein
MVSAIGHPRMRHQAVTRTAAAIWAGLRSPSRPPARPPGQTRFEREDIHDRTKFRGWFRLDAGLFVEEQQEVRDCPAVMDLLRVDGKAIAQGTITAGSGDHEITGAPPRDARFVQLAARRTDSLPCHTTLQWIYAGLD